MNKSLLITLDFPPQIGGIATYYSNLCEHLPHDKIVVLSSPATDAQNFDNKKKYKIFREKIISDNIFIWPKWIIIFKKLKEIIKNENIKNILVGQILPIGMIAYYMKETHKLPYYIFCHGMDISILRGKKRYLAKKIIHHASGIFVNSNFTKHIVENFKFPHEKIKTIYPCPNILSHPGELDIIELKNKYKLHNKKILLTIGKLTERKGQDKVIESLPHIIKSNSDIIYIIAGSGPYKNKLLELAKKNNVNQHIIFIERPDNITISALYELCDIFIMPSRKLKNGDVEGFGIVYLEANVFGKPVIGGNGGGVNEAIINNFNGILVNPIDIHEISNSAIKLLENPALRHTLGLQGMDRVHELFQWEKQAKKITEILN